MRKVKSRKRNHRNIILPLIICILFMGIGYSALTTTLNFSLKANKGKPYEFSYTGNYQTFTVPKDGYYQIELWGAQGGTDYGGEGAYTSGTIILTKNQKLYVYIGEHKEHGDIAQAFNGGGCAQEETSSEGNPQRYNSGGGATDIRLTSGSWDNFASLKSRIMVAAGGGAGILYIGRNYGYNGGDGGDLIGISGSKNATDSSLTSLITVPTGGTQTSGGIGGTGPHTNGTNGSFGKGADAASKFLSAGGGGYYGGGSSGVATTVAATGAGGSSFISGHPGCNAISSSSTETNIVHTGGTNHYSGKVFTDTQMIAGNKTMPGYDGTNTMVGNKGHGHARITYLRSSTIIK